MKIDFKETTSNGNFKVRQFSAQYGFELKKAVEKHPIKELTDRQERVRLLESLERENRQVVTFIGQGDQKQFIEANPQFKSITVYYDENQKRIRQSGDDQMRKSVGQSEKKNNQQSNKESPGEEEKSESNSTKRSVKV